MEKLISLAEAMINLISLHGLITIALAVIGPCGWFILVFLLLIGPWFMILFINAHFKLVTGSTSMVKNRMMKIFEITTIVLIIMAQVLTTLFSTALIAQPMSTTDINALALIYFIIATLTIYITYLPYAIIHTKRLSMAEIAAMLVMILVILIIVLIITLKSFTPALITIIILSSSYFIIKYIITKYKEHLRHRIDILIKIMSRLSIILMILTLVILIRTIYVYLHLWTTVCRLPKV